MSETQQATLDNQESIKHTEQGISPNAQARNFRSTDPRRKSPFMASFLSLLPGLGQVYVGYYQRGFINIFITGSVFSVLLGSDGSAPYLPLGIMFMIFFVLYNVIDAGRRATMYNLSLDGIEQATLPDELSNSSLNGSFVGGIGLLLFGVVALSNSLFGFSLEWLEAWWPVAPIGFGAYLTYRAYLDSQEKT